MNGEELPRSCFRADGKPKLAYPDIDAAIEAVCASTNRRSDRTHPYRCEEHGWHLGRERRRQGSVTPT